MFYNLLSNFANNDNLKNNHFRAILINLSKKERRTYIYKDYCDVLKKISDDNKNRKYDNIKIIPILEFNANDKSEYYTYKNTLLNIIKNIQNKSNNILNNNKIPLLCPLETVIFYYMYYITNNGIYSELSIMDIYSLIYYYDRCSNLLNEKHDIYNCICKKEFTSYVNKETKNDIQQSIINHYENLNKINNIYTNYIKQISLIDNHTNFTYNLDMVVCLNSPNTNFKIYDKHTIMAFSDKHVIIFLIKPQINKLNLNEILFTGIYSNYILNNTDIKHKNYKRYNNKKVLICIITFDSEEPLFLDLNNYDKNILTTSIKNYLLTTYSTYNNLIFDFYNYWKKNKPNNTNSINHICDILTTEKYKNVPSYIYNYFHDIKNEIKKNKNILPEILVKLTNEQVFCNDVNNYLDNYIDEYLELNKKDNDIDY